MGININLFFIWVAMKKNILIIFALCILCSILVEAKKYRYKNTHHKKSNKKRVPTSFDNIP